MKGNYLLEIHYRHNVGHFPLKFAHDIDQHSLLNPLYVLGGGGGNDHVLIIAHQNRVGSMFLEFLEIVKGGGTPVKRFLEGLF